MLPGKGAKGLKTLYKNTHDTPFLDQILITPPPDRPASRFEPTEGANPCARQGSSFTDNSS